MKSRPRVDLHAHTTRSDGATPPRDLVRLAREAGVDVLAVTDHDTTEAVEEALDAGKELGVRVVPGIEMSSRFEGRDVHLLGIGIDHRSPELQAGLAELHRQRRERVVRICGKLAELGRALDPAQVLAQAGGKSVGRKHVARAMVKAGLVATVDEAFDRYLAEGSPANVPANELSARDAARLIARHRGVAVLAHPGFFDDDALVERLLDDAPLVRGIEVYHRYDSPRKHLRYLGIAHRRHLLVTGGSDFHGDEHPHNAGLGGFVTPPERWKDLENRLTGL
jgi:hypothetical protein